MLHAAIDYYSLPTEKSSCSSFKGSIASGGHGAKSIKRSANKKRMPESKDYQLYQHQPSNSHLIPMRWEKHRSANQVIASQLFQKANLNNVVNPITEPSRLLSYQHQAASKPGDRLTKQCKVAKTRQQEMIFPAEELWNEMSKLRSTSFGAVGLVASGKGYEHWHLAFQELMEDLLEDSEDILLTLPYTEIRGALAYSSNILNHVGEGKLVIRSLNRSKESPAGQVHGSSSTVGLQVFSDAIWADPEFDVSRRASIINAPKRILYSIHDALREIVEAYYYPQMILSDDQSRKDLNRFLADFANYLALK